MDAQIEELKADIENMRQRKFYSMTVQLDQLSDLITRLEKALVDAERWKEMAEFQLSMRVYPDMPGLAVGALDAKFESGWRWLSKDADITAAIDAARVQGEKG